MITYFSKVVYSFKYAISGLAIFFKTERNAKIHGLATIMAIALGLYYKINATEWIAIVFAIAMVIVTELINTAIEKLADFVSPSQDEKIKTIKDIAAAAVLLAAISAFVIALIVFTPKV